MGAARLRFDVSLFQTTTGTYLLGWRLVSIFSIWAGIKNKIGIWTEI